MNILQINLSRNSCFLFLAFFINILYSCQSEPQHTSKKQQAKDQKHIEYAKHFTIHQEKEQTLINIFNPWQGAKNEQFHYVLSNKHPSKITKDTIYIQEPLKRIICLSTTHIPPLKAIGKLNALAGMSSPGASYDTAVINRYKDGLIKDIGIDQTLNYEAIMALNPDLVIGYGVGPGSLHYIDKLENLGIPVLLNADYLESHPLGKAEWIKLMGHLFNLENRSDSIFNNIKHQYLKLTTLAGKADSSPSVMTGLPWKGNWYIPGGNSYFARFIEDAGGHFLWDENNQHYSYPVHIESVMIRSEKADFWIHTGQTHDLKDIRQFDSRLTKLKPYQAGNVYNNDKRKRKGGNNDFYESGILKPHIILRDMICILHPNLLDSCQLYYYRKLK